MLGGGCVYLHSVEHVRWELMVVLLPQPLVRPDEGHGGGHGSVVFCVVGGLDPSFCGEEDSHGHVFEGRFGRVPLETLHHLLFQYRTTRS